MLRMLLPIASALAACTPSPQKAAMPSPSPVPAPTVQGSSGPVGNPAQAAPGPIPEAVSAAENPAPAPQPAPAPAPPPAPPKDSPAEARGRKTLSTAFVRTGPDGHLTVELLDGRVLVLRDVVMRPRDYCGVPVAGGPVGAPYCGGYAEIAAARPGGAPPPDQPDLAAPHPVKPARDPARR